MSEADLEVPYQNFSCNELYNIIFGGVSNEMAQARLLLLLNLNYIVLINT